EAAVMAACHHRTPMLLAATLNQVDRDRGYTGWTAAEFVHQIGAYAEKYNWDGPLYPCLDHGGPWLKDLHSLNQLTFEETFTEVKLSISACIEAGYALLHIDPTVDRSLAPGSKLPIATVVERTLELMVFAEETRNSLGMGEIVYEVGTEEVAGGLVDVQQLEEYLDRLRRGLQEHRLGHIWPVFIVAQIGTDLHTTTFDPDAAARVNQRILPLGSLIKGHFTDWVENPQAYPASGVGAANLGPEFTAIEYCALEALELEEVKVCADYGLKPSGITSAIETCVARSGRWRKWLQPEESGMDFGELASERRRWLTLSGARYIWTSEEVIEGRTMLYSNLKRVLPDPHGQVVDRIANRIGEYVRNFRLDQWLDRWG
ncbi:MAG: class II D-tagatose-bisphosphate aldolase, non-catalytic subunit, partial [Anaerolineaceae bacterium]|nr:class II D-tagatose-bisphosphate aldolase, non-catalytic subunit [Anaerolineaceae bacterium]